MVERKDLIALGEFVLPLEAGLFHPGEWIDPQKTVDGATVMPYFLASDALRDIARVCNPFMMRDFDWVSWTQTEDAERVRTNIGTATLHELRQVIHTLLRQERFCEGLIGQACGDGTFLEIARRAQALADRTPGDVT